MSLPCLDALRNYIDCGAPRRPEGISLELVLRPHEAEASIRHGMDSKWARMKESIGVLELAKIHGFHFLVRDKQNAAFLTDWHEPQPGWLYLALDFKQHDTLPVGPWGP